MPYTYAVKSLAAVSDWPALLSTLFPAWAGEPTSYGSGEARITFAEKQPLIVVNTPALSVSGEFSAWEVSKFKLRRALREANLEGAFNAFVAALPATSQADYNDAVSFRTDDPDFAAAMSAFAGVAGLDAAALKGLLTAAQPGA